MYSDIVLILFSSLLFGNIDPKPQSLVLTTEAVNNESFDRFGEDSLQSGPTISKFHVTSNIQFRYAHTEVVSYMKNPSSKAEEISFTAVIPDSAFISNFSMVLQGKEYVAEVKAKEEAKGEYEEAVSRGRGGGLVSQDARDANKFTVAANVEAGQKVEFKLTYEELLERKLGQYEHAININPGQIVEDLRIEVFINESLPIKTLFVPELKESNDIDFEENLESRIAKVDRNVDCEESKAHITFAPDSLYQLEAGEQGLSGQFHVQYDVDRNGQNNEVQVIDGYFVHYFTPENLPTLPKHVVFVLDTSGSMAGEKMNQLKDALFTILDDMTDKDFFNIVTFSSDVSQWNLEAGNSTALNKEDYNDYLDTTVAPSVINYKEGQFVIEATYKNKENAIEQIIDLSAVGGTNINAGLLEGLKISHFAQEHETLPNDIQSIIIFLSDGEATEGVTNSDQIKENVKKANALNIPIYSLGFGENADFNLIKDISASADAFSKQIYEGSDAAIQLENFFAEISSPLLSNIKFEYVGGLVDNSSVSDPQLRTFFKGGEFVVAGKLLDLPQNDTDEVLNVTVTADAKDGEQFLSNLQICLRPSPIIDIFHPNDSVPNVPFDDIVPIPCTFPPIQSPRSNAQNFLQKLHAFLNIKQLLKKNGATVDEVDAENIGEVDKEGIDQLDKESIDEDKTEEHKEESPKEEALRLALENNFVTELTSLVVVRPDEEPKINKINNLVPDQVDFYDYGYIDFAAPVSFHSGGISNTGINLKSSNHPALHSYTRTNLFQSSLKSSNAPSSQSFYYSSWDDPIYDDYEVSYESFDIKSAILDEEVETSVKGIIDNEYASPIDDIDDIVYYDNNALNTTQSIKVEIPATCTGNITLFSKTYLRGDNVTYNEDTEELADFDNKLVSLEVKGNCCWSIFTDAGYGGNSQEFGEGKYTSLVQVGNIFRKASSLKKIECMGIYI